MMSDIFTSIFLLAGAGFMFFAALGVVRFPDLFTRMHAASKASTLGLGFLITALAIAFPTAAVIVKSAVVFIFIFLTVPIGAHMIGRAAYLLKIPFWKGNVVDDLDGRYSPDRKTLRS